MKLSAPAKAAMRALADLTNSTDDRATAPWGWDLAQVQLAAADYPGGDKITVATMNSLRMDRLAVGPAGRYWLSEFGENRIREGLR